MEIAQPIVGTETPDEVVEINNIQLSGAVSANGESSLVAHVSRHVIGNNENQEICTTTIRPFS